MTSGAIGSFPLPGLLGEERAKRFEELDGEIYNHAYLLLSYYVLVLNTEPPDMSRGAAMRQFVDYIAPLPPNTSTTEPEETRFSGWVTAPKVKWPALEIVLTRTALARLDALGPRIRERIADGISSTGEDDIKNVAAFLTHYELFLLKAQPGLELQLLEDTLTGDDLATFRGLSEADRDRVELFFQRGLFNLHYLSTASLPYYQTIPDPTPDTLAEQAASAMEWVTLTRKEELTNTYADSWVSENGFIQFTTGDDPLDDPLPGTNPWCIHPSSAPKEPAGPLLVPSKLPEGMERTVRDRTSMHTMLRKFQNEATHITMSQSLCATRRLGVGWYWEIQIGDRTAYVTAGAKVSADGSTGVFDPNVGSSLIMDIGYGVVSFSVFGLGVTVDDLMEMAASLVPEELTDAEKGPYPQAVLDALGTSFGPVYVPGKLPDGYEVIGQLQARQEALGPRTSRLSYVRASDGYCVFHLSQAARHQQFPYVVKRAELGDVETYFTEDDAGKIVRATAKWGTVDIDGVTIYAQEFSAQPRNEFTDVYFQSQGVWFEMTINTSPYCDHSLEMVAEIATALEPLQP